MIEYLNINIKFDDKEIVHGDLTFYEGQLSVIYGNSGTGKTTILYNLGLLDDYSKYGDLKFYDQNNQEIKVTKEDIGYVFQDCHLHNDLTVKENMMFYNHISNHQNDRTIEDYLKMMNLDIDVNRRINTLSGGQRQRVAIAAALYKNIRYLLLDEPTSYLDNKNSLDLINVLKEVAHNLGIVVVVVTHDRRLIDIADRSYLLEDKQIKLTKESDTLSANQTSFDKLKNRPVFYYAKRSFINNFRIDIYQNIIISLIIAFCSIFLGYINRFNLVIDQQFNDMTNSELKLAYQKLDKKNFNMYSQGISLSTIRKIKDVQYVENVYPFYEFDGQLGNNQVIIQSYYNNELMDKYVEEIIDINTSAIKDNEPLSVEGYIYINNQIENLTANKDLTINIPVNNDFEMTTVNLTININAILSPVYQNEYSPSGNNIIYLPLSLIETIYKDYPNDDNYEPPMYLISFDNLKSINTIIEGVSVVDDQLVCFSEANINELINLNDNIVNMKVNTIYIVLATVIILELYYRLNRFVHYRKELALIKANGLSNLKTTLCHTIKNIYQSIFNLSIIFVVTVIVDILISKVGIDVFIIQIMAAILIIIFNNLLEFIIIFGYLAKNNVKMILR